MSAAPNKVGIDIPAWLDGELQPLDKLEVHLRGLRHKAISVFVMSGSDVLIQRRAMGKYHTPGLWSNTCCTHPNWGEASIDCANRRLNEELGITGLDLKLAQHVEYRADVGGGMIEHEMVDVFVSDADKTLALSPNPDEVLDAEWIGLERLIADTSDRPECYTPWLRIYLTEHMDQIFGARAGA